MNIGIFGGSFNPPHKGHLVAAKAFFEKAELDSLIITVAGAHIGAVKRSAKPPPIAAAASA